ncbi:MAG: hypothetical protein ACLT2F_08085 [Butyricicoccus sp.]
MVRRPTRKAGTAYIGAAVQQSAVFGGTERAGTDHDSVRLAGRSALALAIAAYVERE